MKSFTFPESFETKFLSGIIPEAEPFAIAERLSAGKHSVRIVLFANMRTLNERLGAIRQFSSLLEDNKDEHHWAILPPHPEPDRDEPLPERLLEEIECDRTNSLTLLASFSDNNQQKKNERLTILTTPEGFFAPVPPKAQLSASERFLEKGGQYDFEDLRSALGNELDYDAEAICERPGQYSVRGGLIDVYPLNGNGPVRLDFFDNDLESIRTFDPTTQRSLEHINSVTIAARHAANNLLEPEAIFSYLGPPIHWIFLNPDHLQTTHPECFTSFERIDDRRATFPFLLKEREGVADLFSGLADIETDAAYFQNAARKKLAEFYALDQWRIQPLETSIGMERLEAESSARLKFFQQLKIWSEEQVELIALIPDEAKFIEIKGLLKESGFEDLPLAFIPADVPAGFFARSIQKKAANRLKLKTRSTVFVTERELLGRHVNRRPVHRQRMLPHKTRVDQLLDFSDLADGDHLVHLAHGICIFRGLTKMDIRGRYEDAISLEFADRVTLHISLKDAHLLTRYVGLSKHHPKLGKLGSGNWEKTRSSAEKATLDYAAEMLNLQAQRDADKGITFSSDNEWQQAFENAFPFTETPDQRLAIEDTKADMQRERPMDRLICGDVGFGKTEIAIRAAFKAVLDNYQVAILVPTTILAQQHYETLRQRFAPYPVSIEMLSRFRNSRQQKEIVNQIASGKIDVIVGTHRLLSKDVTFKNLGLLVIDEEHRFGVRHKEKIKRFRTEVDVLTMSATPIPRTLYLALMGARDLSVIETPPADRLPIETLVRSYDQDLVKRAISRELERGGQVFYLHNRVQTIDMVAAKLNDMLPHAKIAVGHGQMSEVALERLMTQFVAGEYDVLVCTTIIENGLDIPNCNTIIIEGADRFGLSQLYQLRGRVGRFTRQAYAYLLLHRHASMLDIARKRLSAMRQHNQLGAGFKIAMRDLELRGAGNLLGHQQSGHIAGIGFDLYCQLLRQSIQRLKGEPIAARIRASVQLDFIEDSASANSHRFTGSSGFSALIEEEIEKTRIDPVSAFIPASYIEETRLRIDFYRQLAMTASHEELQTIEESLNDRFGKPPKEVQRLLKISKIRILAEFAEIQSVESLGNRLKCQRASSKKQDFIQLSGRFPRLTAKTADLRLREIEQFLTRLCHTKKK